MSGLTRAITERDQSYTPPVHCHRMVTEWRMV